MSEKTQIEQRIGERIEQVVADLKKSPDWLRETVQLIARSVRQVRDLPDDRPTLPEFVYRH